MAAAILLMGGRPCVCAQDKVIETPPPYVLIMMGHPGDEERRQQYLQTVQRLNQALRDSFGIPADDIRVLFGTGETKPYPACDAGRLMSEIDRAAHRAKDGRPAWLIFMGHANTVPGGANFNVKGTDLPSWKIAERLARFERRTPLFLWLTGAASGNWVKAFSGRHRCVIAASAPGAQDNETEFPHAFARVLADPTSADGNSDGMLSIPEILLAVDADIAATYRQLELLRTEQAVVDADGDGSPSPKMNSEDMHRAQRFGIQIRRK